MDSSSVIVGTERGESPSRHRFTILNQLSRVLDVTFTVIERRGADVGADAIGAAVADELRPELEQLGLSLGAAEKQALGILALALARSVADQHDD